MRFLLSKIQEEKEDRMRKETDLEEVKRKSEAIFSAITTSNVYQVEWAVLVLELIDWVGKLMKLQKNITENF